MLGQKIRWVALAQDLTKIDTTCPHCLLHPEGLGVEVPQFAQPLALANAYGRARVGPYSQRYRHTKVTEESLVAKSLAGASHYAAKLGFS